MPGSYEGIGWQAKAPPPQSSLAATKRGADAHVRAGAPGPALPVFEQVDQGVRGPGARPTKSSQDAKV